MDSTDYNPSANAAEPDDSTYSNRSSLLYRLSSPIAATLSTKSPQSKPIGKH
ncbi:uncharacterized protein PGTG_12516 [Puccinia graminis f. sp. tritici CRL 75-36-700-3]|uniref:Uncharacterized protein n=1 Tax=Puccinia graminis f. sp. tritici (strain CRL 75-36-700-3 / race SCCL) TaxID=418459 RepID=E3KUW9_PUCGT|nr:uncharacterized protein PGTG_12516 [Puccinia graminis f. sp. tritici CRL 75-36-700-3]EFP88069.2 hypothetical protein PGTG_12516 [Puccinia graminis f. sp. tritici CRL 75-36-700-3]